MTKPLFQKRHYEFLARALRETQPYDGYGWVTGLVAKLKADNPNFNEDKFWRAINEK